MMDRISAVRNIEDALAAFEEGEIDLETAEQRVVAAVRTFATEYESGDSAAYRVDPVDREPVVVVASSPDDAVEQVESILDEAVVAKAVERISV